MVDPLDTKTAAALDRYTVPAMSSGFADDILAKALARTANSHSSAPFRDRRGGWKRVRAVAIGVGVFGLMSAAAAATGVFGDVAKDVPVIGTLIARIAPAKPKPVLIAVAKPFPKANIKPRPKLELPLPAAPEANAAVQEGRVNENGLTAHQPKLSERIAKIEARRAQAGLTPLPPHRVRRLAKLSLLPREARQTLKANIADRLKAAQATGPIDRATKRAIIAEETRTVLRKQAKRRQLRLKAEWQALSPQERASLMQRADQRIKRAGEIGSTGMITRRRAIIQELRARRRQQQPVDGQTPMPVLK